MTKKKSIEDWFCDRSEEVTKGKETTVDVQKIESTKLLLEFLAKTGMTIELDTYKSAVEQSYATDNLVIAGQTKKSNLILVWHEYVFWIGKTGKYWQVRRLHKWEKEGIPTEVCDTTITKRGKSS